MRERMENGIPYLFFFATSQEPRLIRGQATRARKPCLSKTMSHIIYQRRHRCCRSIPSHQFAAVPCSQHRHILIYPNVLHTNNPSQFANRANHPIALTLPAIQGGPFLLDGSWRQVSHFANDTHTHTHSVSTPMCMDPPRCRTIPRRIWRGERLRYTVLSIGRSIDPQALKRLRNENAGHTWRVATSPKPSLSALRTGEELRNDEGGEGGRPRGRSF